MVSWPLVSFLLYVKYFCDVMYYVILYIERR